MIKNNAAKTRASTMQKKQNLIDAIYEKLGVRLSKKLTIKELNSVLEG